MQSSKKKEFRRAGHGLNGNYYILIYAWGKNNDHYLFIMIITPSFGLTLHQVYELLRNYYT